MSSIASGTVYRLRVPDLPFALGLGEDDVPDMSSLLELMVSKQK